jgi:hypothetical protein
MSVELELESTNGNFSFTGAGREWLDVEEGQGMEPGDPSFTEKVFARSLLKYGASLALESLKEKELVFPLKLHAATKELLTALIQEINIIARTEGAVVRWKDEGATQSTYFTLISGQLDDEFDFRLGQNNWLKCKLRLFTQPLGFNEAKPSGVALNIHGTATTVAHGSNPVITFVGASQVGGDGPSLIRGITAITSGTQNVEGPMAMSVLPTSSYITTWSPTAAHLIQHSQNVATNNAIGGFYVHMASTSDIIWNVPTESQYLGEQRVLAIARSPTTATTPYLNFSTSSALTLESVATVSATTQWQLYDLGIIPIGSIALLEGFQMLISKPFSSAPVDVAGLVMLPDANTVWIVPKDYAVSSLHFDGLMNAIYIQEGSVFDLTHLARGAIPPLFPSTKTPPSIAFLQMPPLGLNVGLTAKVSVVERTRYVF